MAKKKPTFDYDECIACGICDQACPVSAIDMSKLGVDRYNKAYPDYLEHSSIVNAVMVYGVANLDHLLDRKGLYKDE